MKPILLVMTALFLLPSAARADHHEVFIHGAYKLSSGSCAVELQISADGQNAFEGADRIEVNGVALASLGDAKAAAINAGGRTNTGDRILFASSAFELDTGLAADVPFADGECGKFAANSIFTFVIDDISFGGFGTVIDTLAADSSFGVNLTAMTKSSGGSGAFFVDLASTTVTVANNPGSSAVIGGSGDSGGCRLSPDESGSIPFACALPLLLAPFLFHWRARRR